MREFYYISLNHCNLITLHDHQSQFKRNKQCKKKSSSRDRVTQARNSLSATKSYVWWKKHRKQRSTSNVDFKMSAAECCVKRAGGAGKNKNENCNFGLGFPTNNYILQ